MKRTLCKQPTEIEIAYTFVRAFPSMTLENAQSRYNEYSESTKQKIDLYFDKKPYRVSTMFYIATKCNEQEIRKKIIFSIFNNNIDASNKFLRLPIKDSLQLYAWSQDVFNGKTGISSSFNIRSVDLIFQFSDEIKKAENIVEKNNPNFYLGRKDIKVLHTIVQNSTDESILQKLPFQYLAHKKYTLDDFQRELLVSAIISALLYIPLTTTLLSRYIESHWCTKILIDHSLPQKIEQVTELIHTSGNLSLLDAIRKHEDNMKYNFIDHLKKIIPFFITIPIPAVLEKDSFFILYGIPLSFVLWLCSLMPFESFPGGFLGFYVCIPLTTFAIIYAITSHIKRSWNHNDLNWDTIEQVLGCTDIVIPQESYPQ